MKNEKDTSIILKCHQLLQDVLLDAFKVSVMLFTPPYQDIAKIDQGMRAAVWTNYSDENSKIHFSDTTQQYRIMIVKSNLGFYNILVVFDNSPKPDFISIGPFRDEELSPNYFTEILKESHIAPTDIQSMRHIYESMPLVLLDAVVNVTKHVLGIFISDFREITPEFILFSEQKRAVDVNEDFLKNYSIEYAEEYRDLLFAFLEHIKYGDTEQAKKALQSFLKKMKLTDKRSMREYKMLLHAVNDYCHLTLLYTTIHPLHTMKLSSSIRIKIENLTSLAKLEQMPNEICRKYCLLIKNYANPDCSRLTKDVISYIQIHLDEELSLVRLSSHFHKNASVLSHTFSKETGQTLTKFIHQTRMREAVRLFNSTDMSVSEVALMVGYSDFSHFSKLFSKYIGSSPREYKLHSSIQETR